MLSFTICGIFHFSHDNKMLRNWNDTNCSVLPYRLGLKVQRNEYETDPYTYSIIKPSIDMALFQYFWRFAQICKKFAAFARKIVFVIVSEQFYYRNNNKNNFVSKCCKLLANLQKYWNNAKSNDGSSIEIIDQSHGD